MTVIRLSQNKINPLVLPVIFADKLGYFEKFHVPVALEINEDFKFANKSSFVAGDVTAVMGDLTFFFDYLRQGKEAVVTSTLTRTIKLLLRDEVTDLGGLRVGVARKGLFPFFMAHDLAPLVTAPEIVWIDNTYERIAALKAGEIDALVAIEPFIQDIQDSFPTRVLWDSRDSDKTMVMWCFDKTFYQRQPQLVKNFHAALAAAQADFNQLTPAEKQRWAMEVAGYSAAAAAAVRAFTFEAPRNYAARDFQLLADFLYQQGQLPQPLLASEYLANVFEA